MSNVYVSTLDDSVAKINETSRFMLLHPGG